MLKKLRELKGQFISVFFTDSPEGIKGKLVEVTTNYIVLECYEEEEFTPACRRAVSVSRIGEVCYDDRRHKELALEISARIEVEPRQKGRRKK